MSISNCVCCVQLTTTMSNDAEAKTQQIHAPQTSFSFQHITQSEDQHYARVHVTRTRVVFHVTAPQI
jgi:hypothetical protein